MEIRRQNHLKVRVLACILIVLFSTAIVDIKKTEAAVLSNCGSWSIVPLPAVSTGNSGLASVVALSANNVWTVGSYADSTGNLQTLALHWNGSSWRVVPSPNNGPYLNIFQGMTRIPGTKHLWAVGYYDPNNTGSMQTLTEEWSGKNWTIVPSPNFSSQGNFLIGVAATSANNAWAVGDYYDSTLKTDQPLIEYWNGTSWSITATPSPGPDYSFLEGVTAISATNVWAVGYSLTLGGTLIEHYNGASWSIIPSPNSGYLQSVTTVSANDLWAVGAAGTGGSVPLADRWNGKQWKSIPTPAPGSRYNYLAGVAGVSASDVWAVGQYTDSNNISLTLIEQWNGTSWSVVSSPNITDSTNNTLSGVTHVSGTSQLWAVGAYINTSGVNQPLAEFYC